ncbi:fungal hydrophobin-domain-containing protein [Trametes polyzona]|nr:fungal hydrophobin-domain-containing protein [Trametes polyzona]
MFAKLTAAFFTFAILAVATTASPNGFGGGGGAGSCSSGALQCCQSVDSANSAAVAPILSALGIVLQDLNVPVGLTCSPISVVGVGGSDACSANAVCCQDNSFGGLISIGCLPVSL